MSGTKTPQSIYRRQLALRLRGLRAENCMTVAEVAAVTGANQGTISRLESGERGTTPALVETLLDCYGVTDQGEREHVLSLVRADNNSRRVWWRKLSAVLSPTRYDGYLSFESSAEQLCSYEPLLMPGLLQTEEYARAVISAVRIDLTPREVERLVEVRMRRQELITGDRPIRLWAVLDEAAVRRRVGTTEAMRAQLERLLAVEGHPHLTVQVVPFQAGPHAGLHGPFVLMTFPDPAPPVVWLENLTKNVYLDERDDVVRYTTVFDHLRAVALSPAATRDLIRRATKEL